MSQSSNKICEFITSEEAVRQNMKYVDDRRKGLITSFQTKFPKFNKTIMGGLEDNTIICISALSGAGKSTLSKCFRDSISDLNPKLKFKQFVFNLEMVSHQSIGRSIVTSSKKKLHNLYSVEESLSDTEFEELTKYYEKLAKKDIFFIDVPGTAEKIVRSLYHYWCKYCKPDGYTLVYEIDHLLLVQGSSEKEKIDDLMYNLVALKKKIQSEGGSSLGIVLSQMNRNIKSVERVTNKELHRPSTSDLFGASSIEMCADYILFSHIPAKLGISSYTPLCLPTSYILNDKEYTLPYFEIVKNRSGVSDITIPMANGLEYFDFNEMDSRIFQDLKKQMDETGSNKIPTINLNLR